MVEIQIGKIFLGIILGIYSNLKIVYTFDYGILFIRIYQV